MGASKAAVELGGTPLIQYPLRAMLAAGLDAVVLAKPRTGLPPLEAPVWMEPDEPSHPLTGIVAALEQGRRPLVVCGCDLPFVPAALLAHLAERKEPLVVVEAAGRVHPLIGRYEPELLDDLRDARDARRPLQEVVSELGGKRLDVRRFGDPAVLTFNVNTPADLARAQELVG
jgi:molybdopterin-guanine dinucleotide biosynthesis protein A